MSAANLCTGERLASRSIGRGSNEARPRSQLRIAFVAACLVVGCGRKSSTSSAPSAELSGLAAVPASAEVVIAADVGRVVNSPLVDRAIDQLLSRDAALAASWQKLQGSCKLDVKQFKHVLLAIGPHAGPQPGTGPVLMVVTGKLVESDFASCVRAMVGQGGGTLTAAPLGPRTLYEAKDGNRVMYFAFGRPDTVVLGANEAFVKDALGAGKKALDNPDLAGWLKRADQNAPMWAVGRVDDRVRQGLVRLTKGQVTAGPAAFVVGFDPTSGAKLDVSAVMASEADAKTLESFAKAQLGLLALGAQMKSLGKIVDKIAIAADGSLVRFKLSLDPDDINQLVSVLDGGDGSAQGSPPQTGSGSSAP